MLDNIKEKRNILFYEVLSALIITFSIVPSFSKIGNLFYQIFLTAMIVFAYLFVADNRKIKPSTVSHSLVFMTVYWIAVALIKQVKLHINIGDTTLKWRHLFYYDRPAMLIVVYFAVFIFFALTLIIKYNDSSFIEEYKKYQRTALISFSAYYLIIIIYCFFLVRESGNNHSDVNLIPFNVFKVMKAGEYEYEFIFLFFGNIGIFFPLGILISALIKNKPLIYIFPIILSVGIEISQYFLRNGQSDIDDVILNVIGFYLGYMIKVLLDKTIYKISKGHISSVFIL